MSNPRLCLWCNAPVYPTHGNNKKFCNCRCAAFYNNRHSEKLKAFQHSKKVRGRRTKQCLNCDSDISYNNIYCNHHCMYDYKYKEWVKLWLAGEDDGTTASRGPKTGVKRYLVETYGEQCQLCGWEELNTHSKKIPIHIHHIDGNTMNNHPENLQLLCPNCHSLTETFGALNSGKGNEYRRNLKRQQYHNWKNE